MITAMTEIIFFWTAVLLAAALLAALHELNQDGRRNQVPPRSHPADLFDPGSPTRPA